MLRMTNDKVQMTKRGAVLLFGHLSFICHLVFVIYSAGFYLLDSGSRIPSFKLFDLTAKQGLRLKLTAIRPLRGAGPGLNP